MQLCFTADMCYYSFFGNAFSLLSMHLSRGYINNILTQWALAVMQQ